VAAGLINALKLVEKELKSIKVVINGAGAAGGAIVNMLVNIGVENILICDSKGIIYKGSSNNNWYKKELAKITNKENIKGSLKDAIIGSDVFIGVSQGNLLNEKMVRSMNKDSIIFALANPVPEIYPEEAKKAGAKIVATGRSDFPNQINNVLAFPGIFRGALDAKAKDINEEMKIAAAYAIANMVSEKKLEENYIIPHTLNKDVAYVVAKAVKEAIQ